MSITITGAPNFTDMDNPTITIHSSGARFTNLKACISLDGTKDDIPYRSIGGLKQGESSNASYTFNLTEAERDILRKGTINSNFEFLYFYIQYIDNNGKTQRYRLQRQLTIVDAKPTAYIEVYDTNIETTYLTNNDREFIKGFSNATYYIFYDLKKFATVKDITVTCNGETLKGQTNTFIGINKPVIEYTLTDSRGNKSSGKLDISRADIYKYTEYIPVTVNIETTAINAGNIKFNISGNFYNKLFGSGTDNVMILLYRYCKNTEDINSAAWIEIPFGSFAISGDTYTTNDYTITLSGTDYKSPYIIQARAADKLVTIETTTESISALPVFDWSNEDFNFNVPVKFSGGIDAKSLGIDGIINAFTKRYSIPCKFSAMGANWEKGTVTMFLYGNILRGHIEVTRKADTSIGDIVNEQVGSIEFEVGDKITGFGAVSFATGGTGGIAAFNMSDTAIYTTENGAEGETIKVGSFILHLASTTTATDVFSAYFSIPCLLNFDGFKE